MHNLRVFHWHFFSGKRLQIAIVFTTECPCRILQVKNSNSNLRPKIFFILLLVFHQVPSSIPKISKNFTMSKGPQNVFFFRLMVEKLAECKKEKFTNIEILAEWGKDAKILIEDMFSFYLKKIFVHFFGHFCLTSRYLPDFSHWANFTAFLLTTEIVFSYASSVTVNSFSSEDLSKICQYFPIIWPNKF